MSIPPRHHCPWEDSMHHRPHKSHKPSHKPSPPSSSSSSSSISLLLTTSTTCNPTLPRSVLSTPPSHHHKTPPPPPTSHNSINVLQPPAAAPSSSPLPPRVLCNQYSLNTWIPPSEMSVEVASEHVCYVHCNFCNTILAVSVPSNNLFNIVTVRCGHCANLLSVNMGALLQTFPHQDFQNHNLRALDFVSECGSSSKCNTLPMMNSTDNIDQLQMLHMRPPEKRQRVPSAYNRFIKEEIQRIKANNPDISHREAFSAAAKNWAHLPRIHFGLNLENNKRVKLDEAIAAAEGSQKSQGFY